MEHTNDLIKARSPYLLQHAHNPVNWVEWSVEVFERAKKEDKLVLISIGYSACHWCHVMERECFENEEIAALMNRHYINVKVDREERPDVDHVYMTAVQLMSGHGGWPLNCFVLPDGRPIYGGTYFPRNRWTEVLNNLAALYEKQRDKVEEYAAELTAGIQQVNEFSHLTHETGPPLSQDLLAEAVAKWSKRFDRIEGGSQGAPKFPMPNNYQFLLRYGHLARREDLVQQVHLTLRKMAWGGIYDQLGGGFARYSTDAEWKVPHFEKMLYDNAQLVTLYCEAYRQNKDPLYKQVVYETLEYVEREMTAPGGGFFSALDADSEGREGLFYVWTKEELQEVLGEDYEVFADHYSVNERGYWEDEHYILLRSSPEKDIEERHKIGHEELHRILASAKKKLMERRNKRVRPGLDDKMLASWNGLMCRGLCEAYLTFGEARFLHAARKNMEFIIRVLITDKGELRRCAKDAESYGVAFLDDQAFVIDGLLALFGATGEALYLHHAVKLTDHCFANFFHEEKGLFYYTPRRGEKLIAKHFEINDNVIPASNSQMALNLQSLFAFTGTGRYAEIAGKMLSQLAAEIGAALPSHSNWGMALLHELHPAREVCVVGKDVDDLMRAFGKHYLPNATFVFSKGASDAALLEGRYKEGETLIYVCHRQACQAPVRTVEEALGLI